MLKLLHDTSDMKLIAGDKTYRCSIGENGFSDSTFEGSKTTPLGEFAMRSGYFRPDRLSLFRGTAQSITAFPLLPLTPSDGWCDDPSAPQYNLPVKRPFGPSHEELWREDHTYDLIIPIGYNDDPIVTGKGSAIFFHVAKPGYTPTLGCVAISIDDWMELLPEIGPDTRMRIG